MNSSLEIPILKTLRKVFGVGPTGAIISLLLFACFVLIHSLVPMQIVLEHSVLIKVIGVVLMVFGLGLHSWSFYTLRNWWSNDKLCTTGPFKYFRHPMYAAWITLLCPGVALYLNSWLYLFWVILIHLLWHNLVKKEERTMFDLFGDEYLEFKKGTGRFFPKILR